MPRPQASKLAVYVSLVHAHSPTSPGGLRPALTLGHHWSPSRAKDLVSLSFRVSSLSPCHQGPISACARGALEPLVRAGGPLEDSST